MKVIYLGPDCSLTDWLREREDVFQTNEEYFFSGGYDFIVSYGYGHLIREGVLDNYKRRAVNLHISYLPWNRGREPNIWSFVDGTPKGVTIHYLDNGWDTGDILFQKELFFEDDETLRTTYDRLQEEVQELFKQKWDLIRMGDVVGVRQEGGSFHTKKDRIEKLDHLLTDGWDTKVGELYGLRV
jgi:methionyl-tRNA formyltransferase